MRIILLLLLVLCVACAPVEKIDEPVQTTQEIVEEVQEELQEEKPVETQPELQDTNYSIKPLLWKIQREEPVYLYATYHSSNEHILTLPSVVKDALDESDEVYTEVVLSDPLVGAKVAQVMQLDGTTLKRSISPELYEELESYIDEKEGDITALEKMRPFGVATLLLLLEEIETLENPTLDEYVTLVTLSKEHKGLEEIEDSFKFLFEMSAEEEEEFLAQTLESVKDEGALKRLTLAYLNGDADLLYEDYISEIDSPSDEKVDRWLIDYRNEIMVNTILDLIEDEKNSYFFAAGLLHFPGENGILKALQEQGYEISLVPFDESDSCKKGEELIEKRCYYAYDKDKTDRKRVLQYYVANSEEIGIWIREYQEKKDLSSVVPFFYSAANSGGLVSGPIRDANVQFLGLLLRDNPDMIDKWLEEFQFLTPSNKKALYEALWFAQSEESLAALESIKEESTANKNFIELMQKNPPVDPMQKEEISALEVYHLWRVYFIENDLNALTKSMEMLSNWIYPSHDEYLAARTSLNLMIAFGTDEKIKADLESAAENIQRPSSKEVAQALLEEMQS